MTAVCESLVLCERVLDDTFSGTVTLVACLDEVRALRFPAQHPGFGFLARLRWDGAPPTADQPIAYRFWRIGSEGKPELVHSFDGAWPAGATRVRVATNFRWLRLRGPERVEFRLDHRLGRGGWKKGPVASIDVRPLDLSEADRAALRAEYLARGLSTADLD